MAARNREREQNKLRMRQRSTGQSVVTSAAYRAGEKLYSEYYGEVSDYTHKGGVVCFDIYFHFSQTSRETFTDKVLRLIQSDAVTS